MLPFLVTSLKGEKAVKYYKELLIDIAQQNKEYFTSVSVWDKHAVKNQLPRAARYAYHFGSWNIAKMQILGENTPLEKRFTPTYSEDELIKIARKQSIYFQTQKDWNEFAEKNNLPNSKVYSHKFDGWHQAKTKILGSKRPLYQNTYSTDELIAIAKNHREYFSSLNIWSSYAEEHCLPKAPVYIKHFRTWNNAKKVIFSGDELEVHEKNTVSKSELIAVAKKFKQHFTSQKSWNSLAAQHGLPGSWTFIHKFKSWNAAKQYIFKNEQMIIKRQPVSHYSKEQLINVVLEHKNFFNMKLSEWNEYAKSNHLPTGSTFKRHFGSWEKAQEDIKSVTE